MDIKDIVDSLTFDEKLRLLNGDGSWNTFNCNNKLPSIMMTDGPHGLRKQNIGSYIDVNNSLIATCFPNACSTACSWDENVINTLASAIAREALKEKISVVLGCGTNIKRSPLCGRNFEYFSEDPFLSGKLATSFINSMQALGVATSLKHFAVNSQEKRRQTSDSQIDERALREIYLTAFEMSVKNAQPKTIMAAYNRINGKYCCANNYLLNDILRKEWGFNGLVVSDWGAVVNVVDCIKSGLDLEMPDSFMRHTKSLKDAYDNKKITIEEIDRAVYKIVDLIESQAAKVGDYSVDYKTQHKIAKEIETESAVLLKNDGILPLKVKKVLVIGHLADEMRFQGAGSSHVNTAKTLNAVESLKEKGFDVVYCQGYNNYGDKVDKKLEKQAIKAAKQGDTILFFGGLTDTFEGEGFDRTTLDIPSCQTRLIEKLYLVNKNIVFVAFGGAPILIPFIDKTKAILQMYLGGQAVGEACAELLDGTVNPSGKLAETYPLRLCDTPCNKYYATDSANVEYRESIFVGYRYYDTFNKPTLFDFGFGLSYTEFSYSDLTISDNIFCKGKLNLSFKITNIGKVKGKEIAQVYIKAPSSKFIRAKKELKGFAKVELLPQESKVITITLDERSFSIFDINTKSFIMPSGNYSILVGASVRNIKLETSIEVNGVDYNEDDTLKLSNYFNTDEDGNLNISRTQFIKLCGNDFKNWDKIKKGEFTIYNSLTELSKNSLFAKLVFLIAKNIVYSMNKGKYHDDPSVKMSILGLSDGPLDSVVSSSDGKFSIKFAEAVVLSANGHFIKAMKRILNKDK